MRCWTRYRPLGRTRLPIVNGSAILTSPPWPILYTGWPGPASSSCGAAATFAAAPRPITSAIAARPRIMLAILLLRGRCRRRGAELHRLRRNHPFLLRTRRDDAVANLQRLRIDLGLALGDLGLRVHHHHDLLAVGALDHQVHAVDLGDVAHHGLVVLVRERDGRDHQDERKQNGGDRY